MRVALAQIRSGTDPAANLDLVEDYTRRAADAGARLVLFPEATMCRFGVPLAAVAEPLDGVWATGVRQIAERAGIAVVAGMFTPADDGRVTNTLIATGLGVDSLITALLNGLVSPQPEPGEGVPYNADCVGAMEELLAPK